MPWWAGAVIYQVYIRSFADGNGDGFGDFAGLIRRLDYIASLGVDAIWLSPIHPSPNRDWGYDVSDYEGVHPDYGTMADFQALLAAAHARGLKILLDEVLAHTSDEHAWFAASRDGDAARKDWYVWADTKDDGTVPNNWLSVFGGPAWSYQPARRQYYHHKFLRQQPKLNWREPEAREAALSVLDRWLARGVDGFRLDVANAFLHDAALNDNPPIPAAARGAVEWAAAANMQRHLHDSNLAENCAVLDAIRRRVETAGPDRFVFGEFAEEFELSGCYLSPDAGLHAGYNFALLVAEDTGAIRHHLETLARFPGHWPCIAFSNHDVIRTVSRFGEGSAKVMLALLLALRGTVLLYQGEELGLPEARIARAAMRDPVGDLYYPLFRGRDGCRTPMPWDAEGPHLGFGGPPWLPMPESHRPLAVSAQERDPDSILAYARRLVAARKAYPALARGSQKLIAGPGVGFLREADGARILCLFNPSPREIAFELADELPGDLAGARAFDFGTGEARADGSAVTLGPHAAWFGEL